MVRWWFYARALSITAALVVCVLLGATASPALAAEARCAQLGANCIGSRTMQTAGPMVFIPGCEGNTGCYYDVDQDTSDTKLLGKVFNVPGVGNRVFFYANGGNNTTAVAGVGHNGRNVWQVSNWGGSWAIAPPTSAVDTFTGRVCARYYFWNSANYVTANELPGSPGTECNAGIPPCCNNDKYTQFGDYLTCGSITGGFSWHENGQQIQPIVTVAQTRGKWWVLEHCLNTWSNPTSYEFYMRNVTDGGTERSTTLSGSAMSGVGPNLGGFQDAIHRYRGFCDNGGSTRMMYALVAHWSSNQGQRIGAASEVEGGPSVNHYTLSLSAGPYALTGSAALMTITAGPVQIGFIHTAALLVIIVAVIGVAYSHVD